MGKIEYKTIEIEDYNQSGLQKFFRVMKRTFRLELFKGLGIVFKVFAKDPTHTVMYPHEKMPIGPRYRGIHELLRLLESGNERCIGCGLCEKICISDCIRMDTRIDENGRKVLDEYTINFGRCIFCGYCAEVCPELAIVHGPRYENSSEQRAHFALKDDMLTPIDWLRGEERAKAEAAQKEFPGFGALSPNADERVKKTPLAY